MGRCVVPAASAVVQDVAVQVLPVLALSYWVPSGALTRVARKWIRELATGRRRSARYGFWDYMLRPS
jgi:hypothetical protein